jgi:hypothetical protein
MTWKPEAPETIRDIASDLRDEGLPDAEVSRRISAAAEADDRFTASLSRSLRAQGGAA